MAQAPIDVPIFDLPAQFEEERDELMAIIERVLASGKYVLAGDEVEALEQEVAAFVGTEYAVTVNSGTDALTIGLVCLGVGAGDEVITPPNSFIASTGAIVRVGAKPVFVDVGEDQNVNPELIESLITARTKAIMPVHLTGRICDMDPITDIAKKHGLKIIEDAAQSMGSEYKGRKSGTFGDVGCFSCHPLKNMNACGDGGLITTDDPEVRERAMRLRNHGLVDRNTALEFGYVSRMDNLQAAILRLRLRHLPDVIGRRRRNVEQYRREVDPEHIFIPPCLNHEFNTFVLFVAQLDRRDELQKFLSERGIATGVHYPIPIHLQPAANALGYGKGDFPSVERQADRIISLPHNQNLSESQVSYVCDQINAFYSS